MKPLREQAADDARADITRIIDDTAGSILQGRELGFTEDASDAVLLARVKSVIFAGGTVNWEAKDQLAQALGAVGWAQAVEAMARDHARTTGAAPPVNRTPPPEAPPEAPNGYE